MAQVFLTRGDLDRALALYQESLALKEQIGDIQGKAASLSMMANLWMQRNDWNQAEALLEGALAIAQQLGDLKEIAFNIAKLGQVAQANRDMEAASQRYAESYTIFQNLGMMNEAEQIERMLAGVTNQPALIDTEDGLMAMLAQLPAEERAQAEAQLSTLQAQLANMSKSERAQLEIHTRLRQAVEQARGAAERKLWAAAITHQEEAVTHARTLATQNADRAALVQLSVLLYNLAGYYQHANRHTAAIDCFAEVVALDEQTGHEDLESDRQVLEHARQLAAAHVASALPQPMPDLAARLAQLDPHVRTALAQIDAEEQARIVALLEGMGPEQQEQTLQALAHFAALAPEEQAALINRTPLQQVEENLFPQLEAFFAAYQAGELDPAQQATGTHSIHKLLPALSADEQLGAGRHDLVALLSCAIAYLQGEALPPIPASYAAVWLEWIER